MSANPPLQGALLLATQLELVSGTTAGGTLYGIAFSLYCLYLHASLPQLRDHDRRRQTQFMMTFSTIIMSCGLYYLISNAWVIQDAYIKHANFPGGPLVYESSTYLTQPAIALGLVCVAVVDASTTAIQIRTIFLSLTLRPADSMSEDLKTATAEYALQAIIIILPTILIAGFLVSQSRRHRKLIGESQLSTPYMNIAAMLIESYAFESAWTIVSLIFYIFAHPVQQFFGNTQTYIEVNGYITIPKCLANR
ncbi:hypothetical protein AGABI2DRAFT_122267 [Agaricus bisporus var. bisporus H97]|uniref:hypothetical protein n=1 Tax=Agaricus bisporus var. bisporus (strain H97 / ATCC MYA-4626 / FGSC 10389) TaxID=936046 RepID=UPI00029F5C8D|nr:hypothetical protein AGABI2DRAFT_122267 [Agaricus bisporus var. bisporus H97]EKV42677.1 hypothetical protein AGABI2DRAFT_122267 [Agaricus bisporus var. bisporus H97]